CFLLFFFFSSRRRHTRSDRDWSSDVCSSDLPRLGSRLASVGFGQTISLVRESDWELAIAAGVFSQFNMQSATNDLINTDYLVGRSEERRVGKECRSRGGGWH